MDHGKNAETAISCIGPEPAKKKEEVPGIPAVGRRKKTNRCVLAAKQKRVELT